ncbi:hypothetical protein F9X71_24660 [Salmonella enterica subsp. enterica]|nr:hypothetical protein [Salmonella enterica subsp. enterica serovar Alachua]
MPIHNALAKKAEKHLQKKIRFKENVVTYREFIEALIKDGYLPECYAVSAVALPTARQSNRWTNEQSQENAIKRAKAGTKMEYVMKKDSSLYDVSKTCFDLAVTLMTKTRSTPKTKTFVMFNLPGQNINGIATTQCKPCMTVYSERAAGSEETINNLIRMDFPGARVVWFGLAGSEEEAYRLAGF